MTEDEKDNGNFTPPPTSEPDSGVNVTKNYKSSSKSKDGKEKNITEEKNDNGN